MSYDDRNPSVCVEFLKVLRRWFQVGLTEEGAAQEAEEEQGKNPDEDKGEGEETEEETEDELAGSAIGEADEFF